MKKIKCYRKTAIILVLLVFISQCVVSAAAVSYTIDNDDAHGHSNSKTGFTTYFTSAYHYNGDARKQPSNSPNNGIYRWIYKNSFLKTGTINASLKAYLNDYSFTDTAARYYVNYGNTYVVKLVGTFNQNTAPGGWNTIGSTSMASLDSTGKNVSSFVQVSVSGKSGCNTGADGIQITLS